MRHCYYLAITGQPRNYRGEFKESVLEVSGPYIGRGIMPIDNHAEWGNRREHIYELHTTDIEKALDIIKRDDI
jgi:hypothetical protein